MRPARFSELAHDGLLLWNPLPERAAFELVDALDLRAEDAVLDVGCGRGELLVRLLARTGAGGVGVDASAHAIALARGAAAGRVEPSRLELREESFDPSRWADGAFGAILCVGASHACGGLRPALAALGRLLAPGGTILLGEGHWRRDPDAGYLAFLDAARDELLDEEGTRAAMESAGYVVVRSVPSTKEDFDAYEGRYAENVERFAAAHPDDPDAAPFLARIRAWRAAYVRWGRDTMGFALHVLRRDGATAGTEQTC